MATSRSIAKNTDFFNIHERLMSVEVQGGRRLLYEYSEKGKDWGEVFKKRPNDFEQINHALGGYQTLAQYARLRHVSRRRVGQVWHGRIRRSWPEIEAFISWRREHTGYAALFDDLVWLGKRSGANVTISDRKG